jgi:glycosyltransferase involved in cell wall biosynthesis
MILAVDTVALSTRFKHSGTSVYLSHLLSEWLKPDGTDKAKVEFHGFMAPDDNWAKNGFVSPLLKVHETGLMARRRLWFLGGMALNVARLRPNLVFLPTAMGSAPYPFVPMVCTILDGMPERLPPTLVNLGAEGRYVARMNAKLARKIITISEWSKKDLIEIYRLSPEKVQVTYLGYDRKLYNSEPPEAEASAELLARWGIRKPFILHHGMVQLRKNVQRLIQACDRVHSLSKEFDAQLVLAGPMGLGHEEILRTRETSPRRDQVIVTGPLCDADLGMLIKNASLCVIPSLYEGFCLPMVEAMACGVPTVASNSSCLPEVSGGILEYFDPLSVEDMAEVIRRALEDSELRHRLREKGLARAAQFSWERCAQQTLHVLAETHMEHSPVKKVRAKSRRRAAV